MKEHEMQAHAHQVQIWRRMSPAEKYWCMVGLLEFARKCKRSRLRALHPNWTEREVEQAALEAFLYART